MLESLKELPKLSVVGSESGPIAVCSPGPSLRETWEEARAFPVIMAVKSAHDFLVERGVKPHFAVTKDDLPYAIGRAFRLFPQEGVQYIAAGRHGAGKLNAIKPRFLSITHNDICRMKIRDPHMYKILRSRGSGGFGLMCAYVMGWREIHLFGFDNCFVKGLKRANGFMSECDDYVHMDIRGRTFIMNNFLKNELRYIRDFRSNMPGVKLIPHGDGVLTHLWSKAA